MFPDMPLANLHDDWHKAKPAPQSSEVQQLVGVFSLAKHSNDSGRGTLFYQIKQKTAGNLGDFNTKALFLLQLC